LNARFSVGRLLQPCTPSPRSNAIYCWLARSYRRQQLDSFPVPLGWHEGGLSKASVC
jgi:hypothetical protein